MTEKLEAPVKKDKTLMYRGKPLVRSGNTIYYGATDQKFVVKLEILETAKINDLDVANKVSVNLISLENGGQRVLKRGEKTGVFDALDIGGIWLERTLSEQRAK